MSPMLRPLAVVPLLLHLYVFLSTDVQGQSSVLPIDTKADYSKEAFVIEQFSRKLQFENDGTSSRQDTDRVRIQSQAGVQRYGLLSFSYPSATGTFEISYVRVRKPDGSVVETPPENVQDMAAEITRQAPFYSDLHEKHVAVKGLSTGDTLEFRIEEHTTKPLAPGHFWTEYTFTDDHIVLDEQLEISVPRERAIKIKSAKIQPSTADAGAYRVYNWHHTSLKQQDDTNDKRKTIAHAWQQLRGRLPQPDVLISSFTSWDEVGRWYGGLQAERVKPTPEVAAKAMELSKNSSTEEAKSRVLYGYVSTQFHYIGIAFGIGRYQPHAAGEVLANEYGDCKDKHTLLASLLGAVGIPAYPALISTSHEIDGDVPSPGQFDHVITVIPNDRALVWLDSTSEVGPYQYLLSRLRDKNALVIWGNQPAAFVNTPGDLPNATFLKFSMDAKLSDAGTLDGRVEVSERGDLEYVLRAAFRTVPLTQWKDLGQRISQSSGFGGDVSEVTASSTEKTDEPFHLSYKYNRKEFGDWANHRIVAPSPLIALLAPSDDELLPLGPSWLGPLSDLQLQARVELPVGERPELPAPIHMKQDFAEYDSTYEFKNGALISERHLRTLMREVPASEREEYKHFAKVIQDDYGVYIPLSSKSTSTIPASRIPPDISSVGAMKNLPTSLNPEAARLDDEARDDIGRHDAQSAVSALYRAVAADPKFTRAWVQLGSLLLMQKQMDAGMEAFRKAIESNPTEPAIRSVLASALMATSHCEEAVPVLQEYVKTFPDDVQGPSNLGICLFRLKKYSEAAAAYETALRIKDDRADLQASLGSAYLLAGERDKAEDAFAKLVNKDPSGATYNSVAYQMAEHDLKLALALDYAKKAVLAVEEESQKITLSNLKVDDLNSIQKMAAYWDTLGWVDDRMSKLEEAADYLLAAWRLTQDGVVADHLCQVYERMHKTESATQMCRLAIYRLPMSEQLALSQFSPEMEDAKKRLEHLTGGTKPSKSVTAASDVSIRERTFKLPRFLPGTESGEFFLLLTSDGKSKKFKVEDVKFISGSAKMKLQGKQLKSIEFNFPAPGSSVARFVRRGILGCYQYSGCSFVLLDPASVHSLN